MSSEAPTTSPLDVDAFELHDKLDVSIESAGYIREAQSFVSGIQGEGTATEFTPMEATFVLSSVALHAAVIQAQATDRLTAELRAIRAALLPPAGGADE